MSSSGQARRGSFITYLVGFLLSLELTIAAYLITLRHVNSHHENFSHRYLIVTILVLAVSQLVVQLVYFLHLSKESRPRWNLTVFSFALTVLLILVLGSLWIMHNLQRYHGLPVSQPDEYIIQDEGYRR